MNTYKNRVLLWDVTDKCNLRCKHCYNAKKLSDKNNLSSVLKTEDALNMLEITANAGFNHIHMLGGEPLMRNDLHLLINKCKSKNQKISINSNGTLFNLNRLSELIEAGLDELTISLDGVDDVDNDAVRGEGVFARVINSLQIIEKYKNLYKKALTVNLAFVMTSENLLKFSLFKDLLKKIPVDNLMFLSLYKCGNALENNFSHDEYHIRLWNALTILLKEKFT